MHRRLASSKVNSTRKLHDECAPNTYEMSSGDTSQPTHINVQSESSAPATSDKPVVTNPAENDRTQPSAPPPQESFHNDTTLIDNDLYQ